ncbi:MAG: MFS transporter [Comamonadaceae bacterium]|nr:MFS transporter [Comamonadaceae bacterium]
MLLGDIMRRREVTSLLAACFAMSAAHGALYVFYSIFLVAHGYSKGLVGWLWALGVIAEIGVFLAMPLLLGASLCAPSCWRVSAVPWRDFS